MYPVRSLARDLVASPVDLGGATSYGMYIFGVIILVFGLAFLLRNLGVLHFPGSFWSLFYPLVIVGVGAIIICVTHEGRKILRHIKNFFSGHNGKM